MSKDAEPKMSLKDQLDKGLYSVDAKKVADAIMHGPLGLLLTPDLWGPRQQAHS